MFQVKKNIISYVYHVQFTGIINQDPTSFGQNNSAQRKIKLPQTKFAKSSCEPHLWNNTLTLVQKKCTTRNSLKKSIKETLLKPCH